jgi:hypothetical protein
MNTNTENLSRTFYFGLSVEVVHQMETCSLVRFSGHDSIVDTDDLVPDQRTQPCPEPVRFLHARVATTR